MKIESFSGDHRFLSNFYPSVIEYEGITCPSVEHAYQAAKTFDMNARKMIASVSSPGIAKKMGQVLIIRDDWESVKVMVMHELLIKKFSDPELRSKLMATGTSDLVEGNTWGDTFWGVCRGTGKNKLGTLLMAIRNELIWDQQMTRNENDA